MLFNSFHFLIFYIACVVIYFALPYRTRWLFLLLGSYYFYMCWKPLYVLLILALTTAGYIVGLGIARSRRAGARKAWLSIGIAACAGTLVGYKYLDFFSTSLTTALRAFNIFADFPLYHLIIPVGISFHTFQSMAYIVDVYRDKVPAEKHFGIYALFVVFFPQLLAGPIERPGNMLPQFRRRHDLDYDRFRTGMQIILWGLFKKVCVADLLAVIVARIYADPMHFSGPYLVLGTIFFGVQIYCDFSGYSDIAVGTARIMGFDLIVNFRQPYFAQTVAEFWRRWHISLSTWFRDYVYYPLGGSRVAAFNWGRNILIVFLLSGLWHGANWTFVIWGALHGMYMLVGALTASVREKFAAAIGLVRFPRLHAVIKTSIVCTLVMLAWVFFRADSTREALYIITHFADVRGFSLATFFNLGLQRYEMLRTIPMILILFAVEFLLFYQPPRILGLWQRRPFRWTCYTACTWGIIFLGIFERVQFIYFQF